MITFYPGPSKIYPQVKEYLSNAWEEGIMSIQHRSDAFIEISRSVQKLLKEKTGIPEDYTVFYTSSSTEGWEITAQSFSRIPSIHIFNGAFGERWYDYRKALSPENTFEHRFGIQDFFNPVSLEVRNEKSLICLTHNETSNGTQHPVQTLRTLKEQYSESLVCVDAASSFAALELPWEAIDICICSSQKCLGLPAGLGLLICSPQALALAEEEKHREHYNSILRLHDKMQNFQTTHTPNVLNIYLLKRVLEHIAPINETNARTSLRASEWYEFIRETGMKSLIKNPDVRSNTVVVVKAVPEFVSQIKHFAESAGIIIGNGYGNLKETSFRIANFPAHHDKEIFLLKDFLREFVSSK